MHHFLQITSHGIKAAVSEIARNKLRSFLSLFGVTIGVFCIISVLATVNSLEQNIRREMEALGRNVIYVDKWQYNAAGPDFPYWKYAQRPAPAFTDLDMLRQRTPSAKYLAFKISRRLPVQHQSLSAAVHVYGVTEAFHRIQPVDVSEGHYPTAADFGSGSAVGVIGFELAEQMFGNASLAAGRWISVAGRQVLLTGVVAKQGKQLLGGWGFDESVILPYRFARQLMDEKKADPLTLVRGIDGVPTTLLKDELTGAMRSIHKLRPGAEDDFSLNDIGDFSNILSSTFRNLNLGGWAIGGLSFLVGIFGVANIMFVSVKERTAQTGIKKALGAKRRVILAEFLLEATFLCLLGGAVGLVLVWILTQVITRLFDFPVFISLPVLSVSFIISVAAGILAGVLPARQAANMDPVAAIRS